MPRSPDPEVRERWLHLIRSFQSGQETVAAFCQRHEVSTASFYAWRRRLGETNVADERPANFQPVRVVAAADTERAAGAGPCVRLPSGIVLELGNDLRALEMTLDRLLAAEAGDAC